MKVPDDELSLVNSTSCEDRLTRFALYNLWLNFCLAFSMIPLFYKGYFTYSLWNLLLVAFASSTKGSFLLNLDKNCL